MGLQAAAAALKSVPAERVLALRRVVDNYGAQKDMWPVVFDAARSVGATVAGPIFTAYYDQGFKERDVDIEVCVPIASDVPVPADKLPDGVQVLETTPAPRVAAITHVGAWNASKPSYQTLFGWIVAEKLHPAGPTREVYLKMDPRDPSATDGVMEIQQVVA